jgi:hypothetical protein
MNTLNESSVQSEKDWERQRAGNGGASEGRVARAIERRTAKIPSDVFLWGAGIAMMGSLVFQLVGPRPASRLFRRRVEGRAPIATFIGQWVPTLLLFGIYNKIVKVAGSDRFDPIE